MVCQGLHGFALFLTCKLIKIREETFMGLVKNNPAFAISVLQKLSSNLRDLDKRLINILSLRG